MAQILLHLPLGANVAEQLNDSRACGEGGVGRRGEVSSPWLRSVVNGCREDCPWEERAGSERALCKPTSSDSGLGSGGAEREHDCRYAPNMRLWIYSSLMWE